MVLSEYLYLFPISVAVLPKSRAPMILDLVYGLKSGPWRALPDRGPKGTLNIEKKGQCCRREEAKRVAKRVFKRISRKLITRDYRCAVEVHDSREQGNKGLSCWRGTQKKIGNALYRSVGLLLYFRHKGKGHAEGPRT